jgi:hypothetical protein
VALRPGRPAAVPQERRPARAPHLPDRWAPGAGVLPWWFLAVEQGRRSQ